MFSTVLERQEQETCRQPSVAEEPIFPGPAEPDAAQDAGGGAEQEAFQDSGSGGEHRVSDAVRRPAQGIIVFVVWQKRLQDEGMGKELKKHSLFVWSVSCLCWCGLRLLVFLVNAERHNNVNAR